MHDYATLLIFSKNLVGITAGILTSVSLLPQLFKVIREKHAGDLSLAWLFILLAGLALWTWYGKLNNDWPLLIANLFSIIITVILIILFFKYGRKKNS